MLSRGRKIAVLVPATSLAAIGVYAWYAGTGTGLVYAYLTIGLAFAAGYLFWGGRLPELVYRFTHLNSDDDPSNLSPKLYLPILLVVIVIAALLMKFGVNR